MKPTNLDDSFAERRAEEEALRELLRDAGSREAVPEEDLTAVKRAALRQWNEVVVTEQRRVRRGHWRLAMAVAAGLTAVAMLVGLWWNRQPSPLPGKEVAVVEAMVGESAISNAAGTRPATVGVELLEGDVLRTAGSLAGASRIALRLASGHSARLDRDSVIEVGASSLTLRQGAVYVDSGGVPARTLEVRTHLGVVRELGTQYEVRVDAEPAALRVRVREGEVGVQAGTAVQTVAPGEELVIDRHGAGTRNTVPIIGEDWQWILQVAAVPEVDGRTLREFLSWFRRETGLVPRYADRELANTAPEIEISGSVDGLTPFEALEVVMAGSGLDYRLEAADLVIERP